MKRALRWVSLVLVSAAVVGPSWAEHAAAGRIDDAVGACGEGDCESTIDIDFGGLSLHNATVRYGENVADAERIRIEPRLDGLHVHLEGLDGHLSAPRSSPPGEASEASDSRPAAPTRPKTAALMGVPVFVTTTGKVELSGPDSLRLEVVDPSLEVDPAGTVTASALARVRRADSVLARARISSATSDGHLGEWIVDANASFFGGDSIPVKAAFNKRHLRARIASGDGTADIELRLGQRPRMTIEADALGLGFVRPGKILPSGIRIDVDQAVLDGSLVLERTETWDAQFTGLTATGIVVDAPSLSKEPLYLQPLRADGTLALTDDAIEADLAVSHGHGRGEAKGVVRRTGVDVTASLAPLPCQALLESMPGGFVPHLEGMQLMGEVDALARMQFEFADVTRLRDAAISAEAPAETPGVVELDFPFLDRCEVIRDAPGIDLESLARNYRHRFLTDAGDERTQILSPGAEGFVTISGAPNLARAFVILEDNRFWQHDGFDREQIERAFWHNLGAKGFSRGASTITQQTARNVWLGHERSLGRKIQEAVLTTRLESDLKKRRILEIYMNIIELGPGVHGVAEAARYHFGRQAHELNVLEALHIASLAPAPVTYSRRFDDGQADAAWQTHLQEQVRRLHLHGFITYAQMQTALRAPLRLRSRAGVAGE